MRDQKTVVGKRRSGEGRKRRRGFTLIEVVIVLAIVALLAAILTPQMIKYLDDAKIGRVKNEVLVIAAAIMSFNKDTGLWPVYTKGGAGAPARDNAVASVLRTVDGTTPDVTSLDFDPTTQGTDWTTTGGAGTNCSYSSPTTVCWDTFENQLEKNAPGGASGSDVYRTSGGFAWRGPYQTGFSGDVWGNRYLANVKHLQPGASNNVVWVLSAGPDRKINTSFSTATSEDGIAPRGDDIGFRIR